VPITVQFLPYFIITTTTTKQRHDSDELTQYYYGSVSLHYSRLAHKSSLSIIIYSFNNSPNFDNCIICVLCVCAGAVYMNQCVKTKKTTRHWKIIDVKLFMIVVIFNTGSINMIFHNHGRESNIMVLNRYLFLSKWYIILFTCTIMYILSRYLPLNW